MTFGERLRWLREQRKMSLDQLASKAEISRAYLWKLEKKPDANPSIDLVEKLAEGLGVAPAELLDDQTPNGESKQSIPQALQELRDRRGLKQQEVEDLARIRFRGRRPTTADDWELIYLQLKKILGGQDGAD
jgi:transcriptional regulator with XRE-family HTH domain